MQTEHGAALLDLFVTVPETELPNGTVVPSFKVGAYHCSRNNDGTLVIDPANKPWHSINYHDARDECAGAGYTLITELQYLAIAYQISQQAENWTGGKVGEGEIYRGLHKWQVSEAQDGNYESDNPAERRWHVLANGERVYDFSGNIYSWVFDDVQGDENGVVSKPFSQNSTSLTTAPYPSQEHGMGWYPQFDDEDEDIDWSGLALVRGGSWGSDGNAGVFDLSGVWPGGDYVGVGVGFRCTKSL